MSLPSLLRAVAVATMIATAGCEKCSSPARDTEDAAAKSDGASAVTAPVVVRVPDSGPDSGAAGGPAAAFAGPWNVLVISIDSLRADMPWAGYSRPIAPRLTALYERSIAYTHAYSTSSFTSKSMAGLLTGKVPSELARTGSFFTKYLTPGDFVCTALDAQDIPCVGGHAHAYFGKGQSGFEYGFRSWQLVPDIKFDYQTDPFVTSQKLTPLAIEMLTGVAGATGVTADANAARPFLAWFHYMDPHDEYKSHEESPHFGKRPRDLYDEEVFYTDLWIGKLLDFVAAQPWAARTVIVVTADHGEAFGEHGITRHAHEVWEELVRVPLFFYVPGAKARTIETPRGHADLMPTFVELLGAKAIPLPGRSLVPELRGGAASSRDVIVDLPEDEYNERRRALVHENLKLIAFGNDARFALFDLEADPKEADDLYRKRPEVAEDMRGRYKDASARIKESPPRGGIPKH